MGGVGVGGSCIEARRGLNLLLVLSLAPRGFTPATPVFSFPQKPTFQIPIIQLNNFPWTVLLSTIEMTSECSKLSGTTSCRRVVSLQSGVRKEKTNCATITLFSLSVLLLTKGFDQSAFDKSLSYCKV